MNIIQPRLSFREILDSQVPKELLGAEADEPAFILKFHSASFKPGVTAARPGFAFMCYKERYRWKKTTRQEGMQSMFVGGEFYYEDRWVLDQAAISTENMTFLNGGKACLMVIGECLREHGIEKVLLPAYLCPSIVNTLEGCGLICEYYQVHPDFSIDLNDLDQKMPGQRAVYFINYFGFRQPRAVRDYFTGLRQKGILVIEDNAQAGFSLQPNGDFTFNSMRKLCAYDGGYLTTRFEIGPYIRKYHGHQNRHLPVMRAYRKRLAQYLYQGNDDYEELVELYERAEHYYESDAIVEGDARERQFIERLDWQGIRQIRRENYAYLLSLISEISELTPIFPILPEDIMPLGLPVYVQGVSRDQLFDELGNAGIGLTIHWEELLHDPRLNGNKVAVDMASKILTLVIDQRTSHKQIDYMVQSILHLIMEQKQVKN